MNQIRVFGKPWFYFTAIFLMAACSNPKTTAGLEFEYLRKGDGKVVAPGQFLLIDLTVEDGKDSVWLDTRESREPALVRVDPENEKFPDQGESGVYRMLSKGDSVTFTIDVATIYEKTWMQPVPKSMDRKMAVTYHLGVIEVMDESRLKAYQQQRLEVQERNRLNEAIVQFGKDTTIIAAHLTSKTIKAKISADGIRYTVEREGSGRTPQTGSKAYVRYKGYTLDGRVFDSNLQGSPLEVEVGRGKVISGWDTMLKEMKKGSRYTIYLPSLFGYGDRGFEPDIKPNTILVFEMEILDIKD